MNPNAVGVFVFQLYALAARQLLMKHAFDFLPEDSRRTEFLIHNKTKSKFTFCFIVSQKFLTPILTMADQRNLPPLLIKDTERTKELKKWQFCS